MPQVCNPAATWFPAPWTSRTKWQQLRVQAREDLGAEFPMDQLQLLICDVINGKVHKLA